MCLLKPGQQNSHCGHEECKNFYLLRNKSCLYDTNDKTQSDSNANKISAKLFQISSASPTQDPSVPSRTSPINMKRTSTPKSETSTDGEAESSICTKKVKFEGKTINPETIVLTPPTSDRPNVNQNIFPSFFGQPNLQAILPNSTFGNLFNNSSLLAQFPQGNQLNIPQGIDNFLPNFQYNLNPIALQSLLQAQAESLKPESVIQPQLNKKPVKSAFVEQVMDFQAKTLTFLENQNKMLIDLGEKNELIQETLACLISEITSLKKSVLSGNIGGIERAVPALEKSASSVQQPISNTGEPIDADELVNYLYGNGKQDFEYRLVLSTEFSLPLYRERNFGFTINLVDRDGNIVENSNRLPVAISLYTCENPPKYIDSNTAGNKILKGFAEKDIVQGAVSFDKIQIKEVTSHFRNGWIFIVVHPKSNNTQNSNVFMERNGVCVDATKIKPLVLEKVIVKAKKTKEKDQ